MNNKKEYFKEYYQKNREKILQYSKDYWLEHKMERMEYQDEWRAKNRERVREQNKEAQKRYKAKKQQKAES